MSTITRQELLELLTEHPAPCISIYEPTSRAYPDRQRNPVAYRRLVDDVEASLERIFPKAVSRPLVARLHELESDADFWTHGRDGLAVFASPTEFHTYDMSSPVPTMAVVADSFHVKPLLRTVQSADRFHVLCLQRQRIRLYEGNRAGLTEIHPAGIPWTVTDALGSDVVVQQGKTARRTGKSGEPRPTLRESEEHVGHARKGDDAKLDAERFFRAVDRAILDRVSRPSRLPLLVVALPEDRARFATISENPFLLPTAVERSPAGMSPRELMESSWKCIAPRYLERMDELIDNYRIARARQLASDDVTTVEQAARDGRVGTLLIEAENPRPANDGSGDPLDDLTEVVLRQKGTVVVLATERMPTNTGLAAIFRF